MTMRGLVSRRTGRSRPALLVAVCTVIGLLFAAPLTYLVWRTVTGDEALGELGS